MDRDFWVLLRLKKDFWVLLRSKRDYWVLLRCFAQIEERFLGLLSLSLRGKEEGLKEIRWGWTLKTKGRFGVESSSSKYHPVCWVRLLPAGTSPVAPQHLWQGSLLSYVVSPTFPMAMVDSI